MKFKEALCLLFPPLFASLSSLSNVNFNYFREQDELSSELSETHSAGSLEFSSDSDEIKMENANLTLGADSPQSSSSKSLNQAPVEPSLICMPLKEAIPDRESDKCHDKGKKKKKKIMWLFIYYVFASTLRINKKI